MSDLYASDGSPAFPSQGYQSTAAQSAPYRSGLAQAPTPGAGYTQGGSGLGTGLMVCSVFGVLAVLAAVFYSPAEISTPAASAPVENVVESDGSTVPVPAEATPDIADPVTPDAAVADPAVDQPAADQPVTPAATAPAATDAIAAPVEPAVAEPAAAEPAPAPADPAPAAVQPAPGTATPAAPAQP